MGVGGRFDTIDFEGDIVDKTPLVKNGRLHAPGCPGLGVNLVEDKWRRHVTPEKDVIVGPHFLEEIKHYGQISPSFPARAYWVR
jgi:hypothetical protein